ncbi:MAG: type III-B CRISPR module RAMP protein Cmr1 [Candidatus Binatia bacterium]
MVRTIRVSCPDVTPGIASRHDTISKKYTIEVITPLFGGGVEPGFNDPVTLIRPSSIRGHLRFWWRATQGARFETVEALREREGEIWGTTENPSPVRLRVSVTKKNQPTVCAAYKWNQMKRDGTGGYDLEWMELFDNQQSQLPYVLFPFQGNAPDSEKPKDPAKFVAAAKFNLSVLIPTQQRMAGLRTEYNQQRDKKSLPKLTEQDDNVQQDIEAALWAWVNFGGIGARTRRGCGALFCKDFAPSSVDGIGEWFKSHCGLGETTPTNQWPLLTKPPLIRKGTSTPLEGWSLAVGLMRDFRQGSVGRDGRSLWPEADSLRAITGKSKYCTSVTLPDPIDPVSGTAFPRAELGLPIVFHFKDHAHSPNDCELYPKDKKRMASPVILRPLAIGDGRRAAAMVLHLTGPKPGELELRNLENPPALTSRNIYRPDLCDYPASPLKRSASGSALDAFIAFAREKGFEEVKP